MPFLSWRPPSFTNILSKTGQGSLVHLLPPKIESGGSSFLLRAAGTIFSGTIPGFCLKQLLRRWTSTTYRNIFFRFWLEKPTCPLKVFSGYWRFPLSTWGTQEQRTQTEQIYLKSKTRTKTFCSFNPKPLFPSVWPSVGAGRCLARGLRSCSAPSGWNSGMTWPLKSMKLVAVTNFICTIY